ncbi:MAG: TRAP transporter substrate-binding protein [Pseudomonadota bacterium]
MTFRSVFRTLTRAVLVAWPMAVAATTVHAQDVTLRLHQFLPLTSSIPGDALEPWARAVEEQSAGRIKVEHYPSMQLGGAPPSLYDQARDGVVDLIWTVLGYTPGRFPKTEAFELPFMVSTGEATSRAFHDYVAEYAIDEFADIHPIVFHTHGPGLIHVKGSEVARLEDMDGLKLRGPTRVITRLLEELGATAVGMPVPQVPASISRGVIDGAVIPWEVTLPLGVAELVDNHTEFAGDRGLYTATFIFAMNKESYEALPEDLRAVIDANSGPEMAARFGAVMDAMDITGREKAEAEGNSIIVLDATEEARWRDAAQPVIDAWIADRTQDGADGAALVEAARALVERYSE